MTQALFDKTYRSSTYIVMLLATFFQLSGMNIISVYSSQIFKSMQDNGIKLHFSIQTANWTIGVAGFLAAINATIAFRLLSRRTIYIFGHLFQGLFLLSTFIFIKTQKPLGALFSICLFIVSFQVSAGTVYFLYVAEVCTDKGMGIAGFTQMFWLIVLTMTSPILINLPHYGVEGLFLTLAVL